MRTQCYLLLLVCLILPRVVQSQEEGSPKYRMPTAEQRRLAIGETTYLPANQKRVFSESKAYQPLPAPGPSDWLASHPESGQTFNQFLRSRRNLLRPPRTILYIQPIGTFGEKESKVLEAVEKYSSLFFQAKVVVQKPVQLEGLGITTRRHPHSQQQQLLSTGVIDWLKKDLPKDAYARIAVTMIDLYPRDDWNFVFGQASLVERTGVYSLARYGEPGTDLFLRRSLRVFTHETGHMFGFRHCIHYQCLMNGCNHLEESDRTPLHLCPICLRKLHAASGFDITKRYQQLNQFFDRAKLAAELKWTGDRKSVV